MSKKPLQENDLIRTSATARNHYGYKTTKYAMIIDGKKNDFLRVDIADRIVPDPVKGQRRQYNVLPAKYGSDYITNGRDKWHDSLKDAKEEAARDARRGFDKSRERSRKAAEEFERRRRGLR